MHVYGKIPQYNTILPPAMHVCNLNKLFQFHQPGSFMQTLLGLPSVHSVYDRNF